MNKVLPCLLFFCLFAFISLPSWSQKKLAVIGSSTSACHGFSAMPDSCYINRVVNYYGINDANHYLNRALDGAGVTQGMPDSWYGMSYNGEVLNVDNYRNISVAMGQSSNSPTGWFPDVVLVNYPSNNYDVEDIHNIMFYFRTIRDYATGLGAVVYVTTSQPRTAFNQAGRAKLKEVKDSIMTQFGDFAIDFWTGLAVDDGTANTGNIIPMYNQGDDIHLNAAGHDTLFQRVLAKNIFGPGTPLPVKLKSFTGVVNDQQPLLKWTADEESVGTYYLLQRSGDGAAFSTIADIKGQELALDNKYQYIDTGATGSVYYRLQIVEYDHITYSTIVHLELGGAAGSFNIEKLYPIPAAGSQLTLQIQASEKQNIHIQVSSVLGTVVESFDRLLGSGRSNILIPLGGLERGMYFLKIINTVSGGSWVRKFVRD